MLNVGWISSSAALWRQGEPPEQRIRFPVPAYLIETQQERILIDIGLHPAAVVDPEAHYGRPEAGLLELELELEQAITEQLDVSTLTRIVLTHLHFDHVGALELLPASIPIVVQRREWEAAHDSAAAQRNFFYPRDYSFRDGEVVLVDGDHDLLPSGSARRSCWAPTSHTSRARSTIGAFRRSPMTSARRPAPLSACGSCAIPGSQSSPATTPTSCALVRWSSPEV